LDPPDPGQHPWSKGEWKLVSSENAVKASLPLPARSASDKKNVPRRRCRSRLVQSILLLPFFPRIRIILFLPTCKKENLPTDGNVMIHACHLFLPGPIRALSREAVEEEIREMVS
jgi:hypothetical protein